MIFSWLSKDDMNIICWLNDGNLMIILGLYADNCWLSFDHLMVMWWSYLDQKRIILKSSNDYMKIFWHLIQLFNDARMTLTAHYLTIIKRLLNDNLRIICWSFVGGYMEDKLRLVELRRALQNKGFWWNCTWI